MVNSATGNSGLRKRPDSANRVAQLQLGYDQKRSKSGLRESTVMLTGNLSPTPALETLTTRQRAARYIFEKAMKNTNTRKLARRFWPTVRVSLNGHLFDIHPADNTTERRLYLNNDFDEPESLSLMRQRCHGKRCLVFDIGANCGMYTVPMAQAAADGSCVLAFEPSPVMVERLCNNVALNRLQDKVTLHQVALGNSSGNVVLHVHPRNHGQSSLAELKKSLHSVNVEQCLLLDFLPENLDRFERFLVKIDVESREAEVLQPFLKQCDSARLPDMLLLEVEHESQWSVDLRDLLIQKGYHVSFEAEGNAMFEKSENL